MQFRIASWQEYRVAIHSWWLVGERREEGELGALGAPVGEEVGVDEAEGVVRGDGDALAERSAEWRP